MMEPIIALNILASADITELLELFQIKDSFDIVNIDLLSTLARTHKRLILIVVFELS